MRQEKGIPGSTRFELTQLIRLALPLVAAQLAQMGMGALGTVTVAILTLVGSRYVAMPLVIGLMPFAVLTVLSARLLRARPRPPKLSS